MYVVLTGKYNTVTGPFESVEEAQDWISAWGYTEQEARIHFMGTPTLFPDDSEQD